MKSIMKKIGLALGVICFAGTLSLNTVLASEDVNDMGTKFITDTNKVWNIDFKSEVDISSLNDSVHIKDLTDNRDVVITLGCGDNDKSAKINPPGGGYKVGHDYKIMVDKNARSKKGEKLSRAASLNFKVQSKENSQYSLTAKVSVAQALPMFKQIIISSCNIPSAAKYKIEVNDNVVNIGKGMMSVVPDNEVKVYIYDSNGKLLATGMLDVSSTRDNINVSLSSN